MPVAFVPKTLGVHVWIFYSLLRGSPCSITDGWRTYIYGSPYTRIHSTLSPPPPPPRTVYLAGFSSSRLRSAYSPLLKPRYMNMLSKSCSFLINYFSLPVWKGAPNLFERSEQIERALIGGWTGSFDNQIGIRFFGYNTLLILYLCFDDNYIILYYIGNFNCSTSINIAFPLHFTSALCAQKIVFPNERLLRTYAPRYPEILRRTPRCRAGI